MIVAIAATSRAIAFSTNARSMMVIFLLSVRPIWRDLSEKQPALQQSRKGRQIAGKSGAKLHKRQRGSKQPS
jgi:molybdopterin biosynthesis enzyme